MFDYVFEVNSNISAKLTAGYLEWMYGGYGGELLYMPDDKNWALGLDAYKVRQRDYDQRFGFQDFETVTGFLRFYYNIPFYDLRLKVSLGKFLGKLSNISSHSTIIPNIPSLPIIKSIISTSSLLKLCTMIQLGESSSLIAGF